MSTNEILTLEFEAFITGSPSSDENSGRVMILVGMYTPFVNVVAPDEVANNSDRLPASRFIKVPVSG